MASGAPAPDLDEVADQLLLMLGIGGSVSEPIIPTDIPGFGLQRFDANRAEHDFRQLLQSRGFELRTATLEIHGHGITLFWVKPGGSNG
jgi:hypothetical protein